MYMDVNKMYQETVRGSETPFGISKNEKCNKNASEKFAPAKQKKEYSPECIK